MSEGVSPPGKRSGFTFAIRNPRDFWGGLVLIALAIIAIWASRDLPGQRGFAFGPGTAPRLFAGLLAALGAAIALVGLPELFRITAEYRILIYGVALLLLIRFRPQGLLGAV